MIADLESPMDPCRTITGVDVVNDLADLLVRIMPATPWAVLGSHAVRAHLAAANCPGADRRLDEGIVVLAPRTPAGLRPVERLLGMSGVEVTSFAGNCTGLAATHQITWLTPLRANEFKPLYEEILKTAYAIGPQCRYPVPTVEQLLATMLAVPERAWRIRDSTDIRLLWHFRRPERFLVREKVRSVFSKRQGPSPDIGELLAKTVGERV
jgi:hypothetical protein